MLIDGKHLYLITHSKLHNHLRDRQTICVIWPTSQAYRKGGKRHRQDLQTVMGLKILLEFVVRTRQLNCEKVHVFDSKDDSIC